ncbi:MAG: sigma-54 dependent transcriptional regulator [Gammaproteobacteria bacterium]
MRTALRRLLERHGHRVAEAASVEDARTLEPAQFHLILSDLRLPGAEGTAVIEHADGVPVIIMTSYASVPSAVDAMKLGAIDYIAKPFDHDELVMLVERVLRQGRRERRSEALKSDLEQVYPVGGMVGKCAAMREVCSRIEKVAPTDATVLILGESGTGKELVARALHEKSARHEAPFVAFNCAAVPEHLIEAELFGYDQGTERSRIGLMEKADGGTLFLDEVGELPVAAQARLLRVLQSGEHREAGADPSRPLDVRIIAATHRDIRQLVQQGGFRSDLYFRLRVVEMTLPPLRERGDDVIELAVFLLEKVRRQLNRHPMKLSRETLETIRRYHWPGNVRELENTMERAVILCEDDVITPQLLAIEHHAPPREAGAPERADQLSLEEYFRRFVLDNQEHMTETELAQRLGISRKALWERRQRFGIPRKKGRGPKG